MLNPETLYLAKAGIFENPALKGLPLVIALSHPQDAGGTAGHLGKVLLKELENAALIEFDVDQLHDYRTRRPRVRFKEDHFERAILPELKLYLVEDRLDTPFLLLSGAEPDLQWQRFSAAVTSIVQKLEVSLALFVSGFPMPVPHTRPLPVTAHGSRKDLTRGISAWKPVAEMPGSMSSLLEIALGENKVDTVGFGINVPQYLSEADLPQSTLLAMEHLSMAAKLSLPSDPLRDASADVKLQIDEQVKANPEIGAMIERLEENYDFHAKTANLQLLPLAEREAGLIPDRDEIGAQIEEYLAHLEHKEDTEE
ncbi:MULTISPECIES: proteasome assembly chaperone family protein [unclassified Rothia (in: high G+C Gram-positive bacteria)]|uniref:proteasome assembly chaperone family protein n=1 Tax=unclassified Rothia (in: high G+C Gram-positive bacteria) TaxID=2689056 RepID=UPI001959219F|nr:MULTISPECIES: PAC2 family protein [unclassified Rothia (in: high G+C Gram-positive bacteria)]MBM7050718.1 PAC2 family protein [Rothia sp. ZJ1223]QRZ60903.1 PAC2 family protein [Rothia sp. ZJ932]